MSNWKGGLPRKQAIEIFYALSQTSYALGATLHGGYDKEQDASPELYHVFAALGVTEQEYREVSGEPEKIDCEWPIKEQELSGEPKTGVFCDDENDKVECHKNVEDRLLCYVRYTDWKPVWILRNEIARSLNQLAKQNDNQANEKDEIENMQKLINDAKYVVEYASRNLNQAFDMVDTITDIRSSGAALIKDEKTFLNLAKLNVKCARDLFEEALAVLEKVDLLISEIKRELTGDKDEPN